jgi:hypothetical protein
LGRITTILRYQWRAYWRRFTRAGNLTAGNQGFLLLLSVYTLFRYFHLLRTINGELASGTTLTLERLLFGMFLVWLFPLFGSGHLSVSTAVLRYLPLSVKELFVIKTVSLLMPLYVLVLLAASIAVCYPLAHAPSPLAGVCALVLFIVTSFLIGLTMAQLLSMAFWRKLFGVAAIGLFCGSGFSIFAGQHAVDKSYLPSLAPSGLVAQAATGQSWPAIFILCALALAAFWAAFWSFQQSLEPRNDRPAQKNMKLISFKFPGKTGGLSAKDLRYSRRLLEPYFGVLTAALCSVYLVTVDVPSSGVFWVSIIVIFVATTSVVFNCFGLDNPSGLDRYSLLPLNGSAIILSKNVAFLIIIVVQLVLLLPAAWRLGWRVASPGLVQAALLALAYMTWGNWLSVSHPVKMQFYRLASGSSPVDILGGVVFGCLPGVVAIKLFDESKPGIRWLIIPMLLLYGALYWGSLVWAGRHFERHREKIASR